MGYESLYGNTAKPQNSEEQPGLFFFTQKSMNALAVPESRIAQCQCVKSVCFHAKPKGTSEKFATDPQNQKPKGRRKAARSCGPGAGVWERGVVFQIAR